MIYENPATPSAGITSAFNWKREPVAPKPLTKKQITRAKSKAKCEAKKGLALDSRGRAVVNMAPRTAQAITISKTPQADAFRNDSIRRGGI